MKIGVSSYSYQQLINAEKETQLSIMKLAKEAGFEGIEFTDLSAPEGMTEAEYASLIREESEKLSLPVIAYTISANLLGERTLDEEVERVCKKVDIAEILGAKNMRHDMYHNVQSFSFSNIDKFSSSSLVTRLTTDVTNLQNSYQMLIRIAVRSPIMTIMSLVMAFRINAKLASVFICVIPFLGTGLFLITKKAHPVFKRMFKKYDRLNTVVSENLRGIRVVKSFVREDTEENKFKDVSGKIYEDSKKAEGYLAFNAPIMQFSSYTCMIAIAWLGARMIVSTGATALSTGDLYSVITYTMQILMNLMTFSMLYVMLTMSKASAERITEVLNEESDLKSPGNAIKTVKDGSVEFSGVGFSYSGDSEHLCLKNVNIRINSGETVGIIGATGSSKTSFVQLIPRLYDVTEGQLKVGGIDVREYDLDTLRNEVAMVLQKNVLFSGTIKDNLRWGNENATDEEVYAACKNDCKGAAGPDYRVGYFHIFKSCAIH